MQIMSTVRRGACLIIVSSLLGGTAIADAAASSGEPAVWASRDASFVYQGFTAHYSCDGLRDKMRQVLLQLGARPDLHVTTLGCTNLAGPDPFPGVRIKMNVLQPAPQKAEGSAAAVGAHWKTVEVSLERDPVDAAGTCELVEQIKLRILPLFTTRNLDYRSTCIPHQLDVGGTKLRVDVLLPDQNADATAEAAH